MGSSHTEGDARLEKTRPQAQLAPSAMQGSMRTSCRAGRAHGPHSARHPATPLSSSQVQAVLPRGPLLTMFGACVPSASALASGSHRLGAEASPPSSQGSRNPCGHRAQSGTRSPWRRGGRAGLECWTPAGRACRPALAPFSKSLEPGEPQLPSSGKRQELISAGPGGRSAQHEPPRPWPGALGAGNKGTCPRDSAAPSPDPVPALSRRASSTLKSPLKPHRGGRGCP